MNREIFSRVAPEPEVLEDVEAGFVAVGLFDLLEALQEVFKESQEPHVHEITMEQLSITDRINTILAALQGKESMAFVDLFSGGLKRSEMIVTFLALLELVKLRTVRFMQNTHHGAIWLFPSVTFEETDDQDAGDDTFGYS